jgi:hypothetical protein
MGRVGFLKFIQDQWWKVAPVEHVDLTGKTVIVVGANVGLGFEAAKHFASMNPKRVVLGCRNQEKGQAALQGKRADLSTEPSLPNLVTGQPYKPLVSKMPSFHSSTSLDLSLYWHLPTLLFAMMLK